MIEAGANEVPDDVMHDAIMPKAHEQIEAMVDFIATAWLNEVGQARENSPHQELDPRSCLTSVRGVCHGAGALGAL